MNKLKVFENQEFGKIRTIEIDGEPWLVGKDVAEALGYSNPRNAVPTHVDDEDKLRTQIEYAGQKRDVTIINESGLYSLILSSKLPSAKKFKRWVTSEVLPSIRKTGMYTMPQDYVSALRAYADQCERNMLLEGQVKEKEAQITAMTPKVDYHDRVLDTENLYTTTVIAKEFGKTAAWMNDYLHDRGIQFKQSGKWILYQKYADKGYTGYATALYKDSSGTEHSQMYMKWTQSGRQFIHKLMDGDGYFPIKNLDKNYDDLY